MTLTEAAYKDRWRPGQFKQGRESDRARILMKRWARIGRRAYKANEKGE